MKLDKSLFGTYQGQDIHQYILENDNRMVVKVMDFGATITSITLPGKDDKPVSIACGFDTLEGYFSDDYKANAPYFGCTVGRYCSQIKDASFSLNGDTYKLAANCGNNNLHGGSIGFDKKMWKAESFEKKDKIGVEFSLFSADMEEGFPGNVEAKVTIYLNNDNEIVFDYSATTDKSTPLSMTNHTYFNLTGFKENVEKHQVKVKTNTRLECDDTGAATGKIIDVSNTAEDLRDGKVVSDVHSAMGDGFEHFYTFDNSPSVPSFIAEVQDPESRRKLEVYSTEPCMLFYTGKYTSDALKRNESEHYGKYRGFACETHRYPNGPNIENSPRSITNAGEKFKSTTIFRLTW